MCLNVISSETLPEHFGITSVSSSVPYNPLSLSLKFSCVSPAPRAPFTLNTVGVGLPGILQHGDAELSHLSRSFTCQPRPQLPAPQSKPSTRSHEYSLSPRAPSACKAPVIVQVSHLFEPVNSIKLIPFTDPMLWDLKVFVFPIVFSSSTSPGSVSWFPTGVISVKDRQHLSPRSPIPRIPPWPGSQASVH